MKSEAKLKSEGRKQTDFAKLLSGGKRGTKMPISFNSVYFQSQGKTFIIECTLELINQNIIFSVNKLYCIPLSNYVRFWELLGNHLCTSEIQLTMIETDSDQLRINTLKDKDCINTHDLNLWIDLYRMLKFKLNNPTHFY